MVAFSRFQYAQSVCEGRHEAKFWEDKVVKSSRERRRVVVEEYGEDIDAHDAVIRFNGGITKGFEKYVGFRRRGRLILTTLRFLRERWREKGSSSSSDDGDEGEGSEENNDNNIEIEALKHATGQTLTKYGQLCEKGTTPNTAPNGALTRTPLLCLTTVARGGPSGFWHYPRQQMSTHNPLWVPKNGWHKVKYHY